MCTAQARLSLICSHTDSTLRFIRRCCRCLYGMDRSTAAVLGRPLTIHDEDIDVDYPMDVDDEYWETDDPALAFQQPAGKPSRVSGFIALLKLHQINGYCLRTIYSINKCVLLSHKPRLSAPLLIPSTTPLRFAGPR